MAEMIPQSINSSSDITAGEKLVFKVLQEALFPDEDFIVWHEPRAIDRYPDFVVWSQNHGLLVIEVKDWRASQIVGMNQKEFTLKFSGSEEKRGSPLLQARTSANKIMNHLKKVPGFVNESGEFQDKLKFPIGYCVAFTNITKEESLELGIESVLAEGSCFYKDDLDLDFDDVDNRKIFKAKFKKVYPAVAQFCFEPLDYELLKNLRYQIFPEVRINRIDLLDIQSGEKIKALDNEQEQIAKSLGEGHRILKGVAGSGKTVVLACRARYLKMLHPNWKILIVCYNITLSRYLEKLLKLSNSDGSNSKIDVLHFHGLVKKISNSNLSQGNDETGESYDKRVGELLLSAIQRDSTLRDSYDAIFVDEGQDFLSLWMQGITLLLSDKTDSLLFCYDPAQNVFGRSKPNWKSAGIKVQGKKPTLLHKSYRSTAEIIKFANDFETQVHSKKIAVFDKDNDDSSEDEDSSMNARLFPEIRDSQRGSKPIIVNMSNSQSLINYLIDQISYLIHEKELSWSDICVMYTNKYCNDSLPNRFFFEFQKKFGEEKIYHVDSREQKVGLDLTAESVKLSTIHSMKGLEFRVVFLVGLEELTETEKDISLAYVGMTRAQELVCIPYCIEKGLIPALLDTEVFQTIQG